MVNPTLSLTVAPPPHPCRAAGEGPRAAGGARGNRGGPQGQPLGPRPPLRLGAVPQMDEFFYINNIFLFLFSNYLILGVHGLSLTSEP